MDVWQGTIVHDRGRQTVQRTVVAGLNDFGPIGTKHAPKTTGQRCVVNNVVGTVGVFEGKEEVQGVEEMGFGFGGCFGFDGYRCGLPDACPGVFD